MAKPTLKAVPRDVDMDLGNDFEEQARQAVDAAPTKTSHSVKTMIADSSAALSSAVTTMRKKEAEIEAMKAKATADYDRTIAAAKALRDDCHADADADLHQLRTTLGILDPARAKLAETA